MPSEVRKQINYNTRHRVVKQLPREMLHGPKTVQTYERPQNLNSIYLLALKRKFVLR